MGEDQQLQPVAWPMTWEVVQQHIGESLCEIKAKLQPQTPILGASYANIGEKESLRLVHDNMMIDIDSVENGVWSEEEQLLVSAIKREADFVAFITPELNSVLAPCGMVFVNSEKYPWLRQSLDASRKTDRKPDGFATHAGMYRAKPVPNDGVQRGNGVRFGIPQKELYDCLILFEAKLKITDAAFGQVIRSLQNISPTATACAVLFDLTSFWLVKSYKSVVVKVEKSTWVNKGSKQSLQQFITRNMSPWVTRLTNACSSLDVDVLEGDAFLGRGAFGRVFKTPFERLYDGEEALKNTQDTGLTITPVEEAIDFEADKALGVDYDTVRGAALLLRPVGDPLPRSTTLEEVQQLFKLLWQLHTKGWAHGDPRVPNVIVSEGKLLWIDPVETMKASTEWKETDAKILIRSVLQLDYEDALDPVLEQLISNYGNKSTSENVALLAIGVHNSINPNL